MRLSRGWRRRNNLAGQQEEQRQSTAIAVASLADTGRNYGRNYMAAVLQLQGHKARFDDITDELRQQNPDSTSNRKPGKGKRQPRAEFINASTTTAWASVIPETITRGRLWMAGATCCPPRRGSYGQQRAQRR